LFSTIVFLDTEGADRLGSSKNESYRWRLKMSIEWESLMLAGNELKTVGLIHST